jgi:hypothetical protein
VKFLRIILIPSESSNSTPWTQKYIDHWPLQPMASIPLNRAADWLLNFVPNPLQFDFTNEVSE